MVIYPTTILEASQNEALFIRKLDHLIGLLS